LNLVNKAIGVLREVVRKETTTVPGLINLIVLTLGAVAAFTTGAAGTFASVAATARNEDPPVLTTVLSFALGIAVLVTMLMCVSILSAAERD
jgi:hypothetical protein